MIDSKQFATELAEEYSKRYPDMNDKLLEPLVVKTTARMIALAIEKLQSTKD